MATGTPVITFDIGGIPREYLPYLYVVKKENVTDLANEIQNVLNASDRNVVGNNAKQFVELQKNINVQCKKIWAFTKKLEM